MRVFVPRTAGFAAIAAMCLVFITGQSFADVIKIDATDSGWYNSSGTHDSTNKNYIAGFADPYKYNDYFVFDLSSVKAPIFSAQISLYMPATNVDNGDGYVGPPSVFSLDNVTVPTNTLMQNQSGATGVAIYTDLGSGTLLGSVPLSTADNGNNVVIDLNSDGIALLNAGIGGLVALGGSLATLGTQDQYAFGWTGEMSSRIAIVASVPEPLTAIQIGIGLSALMTHNLIRRRVRAW